MSHVSVPPSTYSVWVIPAEPQRAALQRVIDGLALQHALPPFPIHLTLIPQHAGALPPLLAACAALQASARAFALPIADPAAAGQDAAHWRFRCVYLLAAQPPPPALLALRAGAAAALGLGGGEAYMPHLSLAYSECDAATRSAWAAQSREAALGALGPTAAVACAALEVWDTSSPDPTQWRRVAEYPLAA
jgi:hypothetical protein